MPKTTPTLDVQSASHADHTLIDEPEFLRNKYPQSDRTNMDESSFCGPGRSFPVLDAEDVTHAAERLHNAKGDQSSIKSCVIGKAKAHGWPLPETWTDGDKNGDSDRTQEPESTRAGDPGLVIGADGSHKPFTGLHIHAHSAFGDQGDDGMHDHKHEHNNDADHHHTHLDGHWQAEGTEKADTPDITRSMPSETTFYAPIMRIDRDRREVVLRATAEAFDSYGTVIGFDGSKAAFGKWRGNIREMHDPTKAVGRALKYDPVEAEKAIDLTLRVSKGAEDTWQKCLDGTLAGGSIGARNGVWEKRIIDGKEVPYLARYDLVEVSLVDNPSCPGCDIKIVRSDNLVTDVLDFTEDTLPEQQQVEITRVGARIATNTMMSMHKSRDHAALGLREQLANCSCDECQSALNTLDPDGDGDVDILASLDTDHDGAGQAGGDGSGTIMKYVETEITRHLAPTIQRMNGIAARLAATDTHTQEPDPELTRRFASVEQRLAGLDEVRSLVSHLDTVLGEVKHLAEEIAAQPQPGGPIVNSAVMRQASPEHTYDPLHEDAASIARLAKAGLLNHNQQIEAALYLERERARGQAAGAVRR